MPTTRPTECVESLRVNFDDEEKRTRGLALAEAFNALGELDDEESVIKAQMKEKRAGAEAKVSILARELAAGFTVQMVKCRLAYDDPNPNEVSYYRVDTDELVKTRPFTREERQADLPLADGTIAVEAVSAEESQKNMTEFFEKPVPCSTCGHPESAHPLYQDETVCNVEGCECEYFKVTAPPVDERSDDEPEPDPLRINTEDSYSPSRRVKPPKAPDEKTVAQAARNLSKM
jgi:hypothetical protein